MTPGEIRRLYFIIRTFLSYGLDELIPIMRITMPLRIWRRTLFWMPNRHQDKLLGERLRLALQELGPVWIKFGQMLSTRRDLFPPMIADQLALLQDKVAPFEGKLAKQQIEKAMGDLPVETWFDDFDIKPLASASIAQVHTARLKENGKEVVIKVIRPDILPIIKADMKLIYRLARWVPRLLPDGRRLRPLEVVREYEKTLIDELNLLRESANAIQLRRNFENSPMLYVPEVYSDYCSQDMMVMERIYGIPVSDVATLEKQGTNMKLLAERGVRKAVKLAVSVPSHTPLMRDAADQLAAAIADVAWHPPALPVVHNVDAAVHQGADAISQALVKQLYLPVQWTGCVQQLAAMGVTCVAECGPGKVLSGLIKRIDKSIDARALGTLADFDAALAQWPRG